MNSPPTTLKKDRVFRPIWKDIFSWLDERDGIGFCVYCNKSMVNYITHIKRHSTSVLHKKNVEAKRNQASIETLLAANEESSLTSKTKFAEYCLVMFCIVHHLPMSVLDTLPAVLRKCFPDSLIAKNIKCGRTKATKIVKNHFSVEAKGNLVDVLKKTSFSLIADETTDVSSEKALALVARFYCKKEKRTCDKFFGLLKLERSDAESIFNCIKDHLNNLKIPIANIIGLATDNASVMAGEFRGLCAKFKSYNTDIFFIRCVCHSLHLCASSACKKLPVEIERLARDIYNFFSHSPKRIFEFKEFQDYVGIKNHKILRLSGTRWLSLKQVVDRILSQWSALQLFFLSSAAEDGLNISKEIAEQIASPSYKMYFYFLSHILDIVKIMNVEFQAEGFRLHKIYNTFEDNLKLILSFFIKKNIILNTKNISEIDISDISNYLPLNEVYIGANAETYIKDKDLSDEENRNIKTKMLEFYVELCLQIKKRFNFNDEALQNISLVDPEKISSEHNSILPLLNSFPNLYKSEQKEKICTEFRKLQIQKNLKFTEDIELFWGYVGSLKNAQKENLFENLTEFVSKILSLPHSSAAAERVFSELNLIKNDLTNRYHLNTIEAIMFAKQIKEQFS